MKKLSIIAVFLLFFLAGCASNTPKSSNNTNKNINQVENKKIVVKKPKIIAVGDSLTEGYGVDKDKAYPAQLQTLINQNQYEYTVVNAGISGETSSGLKERIEWILKQKPEIIIVNIGANDAMRGIDLALTKQNILDVIETIQSQNITVVFGGMQIYENLGTEYVQAFENLYVDIAQQKSIPFIPFFLQNVAGNPNLNLEDQIHPNQAGYKIIVEKNIWPVLEPLLKTTN